MSNMSSDDKTVSAPPARKVCEKFHFCMPVAKMAHFYRRLYAKKQPSFAKIRQAGITLFLEIIGNQRFSIGGAGRQKALCRLHYQRMPRRIR
jgi:hypothetical protein